jgi:hypothetical protein
MAWVLYVNTDKGWKEESKHDDRLDAEHSLNEWLDEFPGCKFMMLREVEPSDKGNLIK